MPELVVRHQGIGGDEELQVWILQFAIEQPLCQHSVNGLGGSGKYMTHNFPVGWAAVMKML